MTLKKGRSTGFILAYLFKVDRIDSMHKYA